MVDGSLSGDFWKICKVCNDSALGRENSRTLEPEPERSVSFKFSRLFQSPPFPDLSKFPGTATSMTC